MGDKDLENKAVGIIVTQPTADDLRPTKDQIEEQRRLAKWEKYSKENDWVVGEPAPNYT